MTGKGILRMTLWVLLPILGLIALLFLFQDRMIYFPRSYSAEDLTLEDSRVTPLRFRTAEGRQTAFYVRPEKAGGAFPENIWVVFGGNATLALDWREFAERFPHRAGFLLVDYPGYGACEGKPGPTAILESTQGALDALADLAGLERGEVARRVSFLGHSIGAAAALQAGSRIPARRMLLIAPFTSLHNMARRSVGIPLAYLLRHDFDNVARLEEIVRSPHRPAVTIVHGDRDEVIPVEMGRTLAASQPDAVRYYEIRGADHNSLIALQESLLYREMMRIDIQGAKP